MGQPHSKPAQWQYHRHPQWQNVPQWYPQWPPQWHPPNPYLIHPPPVQFNQPPVQFAGNQPPVGLLPSSYLPPYPKAPYQPSAAQYGWQPSAAYQQYYKLPIPNPPNSMGHYYHSDLPSHPVVQPPSEPTPRSTHPPAGPQVVQPPEPNPIDPPASHQVVKPPEQNPSSIDQPASQKFVQPPEPDPRPIGPPANQKVVQPPKPILRSTDQPAGQLKQKSVRFSDLPPRSRRPISKRYHPYLPQIPETIEPQPSPPSAQQPVAQSPNQQPVAESSSEQPLANPSEINRLFAELDYWRLLDVNYSDQPDFQDFKKLLDELAYEKLKQQELPNQAPPPARHKIGIVPNMLIWLYNVKFTIERFPEPAAFANDLKKIFERDRPVLKELVNSMIAHSMIAHLREISVQPTATPAADAPSDRPAGSGGSQRSDVKPITTNNQDLVLAHWNLKSFDNYWLPSECVDEAVVRYCYGKPPDLKRSSLSKVKRVKIIGFRRKHLHELLLELGKYSEVLELHIDTLQLTRGEHVAYHFSSLRTLRIDVVQIINESGNEIKDEDERASLVTFNAPKLNAIFMNRSRHLQFPESKPFVLATDRFPADLRESRFKNLLMLVMNRIRDENLPTIMSIARGELLPLLARFYLMRWESTSSEAERSDELLRRLHRKLQSESKLGGIKPWLSIYVDSTAVARRWI